MKDVLVSICCISYNHEHCIKDALDGFVMQKTTFPFEIVISDDCSKDSTRQIIEEYKAKYPELIHDVSPEENMGSMPNFLYVQSCAKGKYVAICEGDDYWIDPYKLQRQVDYMESHPQCSCCAHNAIKLKTKTSEIGLFNKKLFNNEDFTLDSFLVTGWFTPTASLLYRKEAYQRFEDVPKFMHGDYSLTINLLLKEGSYLHYDEGIMSVYRKGGWASTHYTEIDLWNDFIAMLQYFKSKSDHRCDDIFDKLIEREEVGKSQAIQYQADLKKSRSLFVRVNHWLSRMFAEVANMRVKCIHVTKKVEREELPNIEILD